MNIDNKAILATFLCSGLVGMGCKMILSTDVECEKTRKILSNIPMGCAISGVLLVSALRLLPLEEEEDPTEENEA